MSPCSIASFFSKWNVQTTDDNAEKQEPPSRRAIDVAFHWGTRRLSVSSQQRCINRNASAPVLGKHMEHNRCWFNIFKWLSFIHTVDQFACAAAGTEYTHKRQSRFVHSNTLIFKSEIYSVSIVCGSVPKKKNSYRYRVPTDRRG